MSLCKMFFPIHYQIGFEKMIVSDKKSWNNCIIIHITPKLIGNW